RVTAARSGFKQLAAEAQVTLGAPVTLNLTLAVGAASETVNVTADAAAVELANAEVSRNVGDRPDLVQPNLLDGTIIDSPNKTLPRAAFSNVATPARI
ncbi:MAG: hypothetical protein ACREEM_40780, partial [Blastocatellia bacterium]